MLPLLETWTFCTGSSRLFHDFGCIIYRLQYRVLAPVLQIPDKGTAFGGSHPLLELHDKAKKRRLKNVEHGRTFQMERPGLSILSLLPSISLETFCSPHSMDYLEARHRCKGAAAGQRVLIHLNHPAILHDLPELFEPSEPQVSMDQVPEKQH